MKMKRLLLFLFTVAFVSLLSSNAFAQWGKTVTVSNDSEFQKALQDRTVEKVSFTAGYYSNIDRKVANGEILEKMNPGEVDPSRGPLACTQGYFAFPNECYFAGITRDLQAFAFGSPCPIPIGWFCVATSAAAFPTITANPFDVFNATASDLEEGAWYVFEFRWVDLSKVLTTRYHVWGIPTINAGVDQNLCIDQQPTFLPTTATLYYPGTGVATYSWSSLTGEPYLSSLTDPNPVFNGAPAGVYTFQVTITETVPDSYIPFFIPGHSCTATDEVIITIYPLPGVDAGLDGAIGSCAGQTYNVNATADAGTTLLWTGSGAPFLNFNNIEDPIFNGALAGLGTWELILTATDSYGCDSVDNLFITVAPELIAAESHTNVSCFGGDDGTATITASGGTAPYVGEGTFTGLSAGTYTYTVSDANGCSDDVTVIITEPTLLVALQTHTNVSCFGGSDGTATITAFPGSGTAPYTGEGTFIGLAAGTYTYIITDALFCTASVDVTITAPTLLVASETHTNVSCFGGNNGTATITAAGGTAPYTGEGTITGLVAGTYTYLVTDANGCTDDVIVTITEPAVLVASESHTNVSCFGGNDGTATITASGGTAPYVGEGTFTGLVAGTYTYTVSDALGCTDDVIVIITEPTQLVASETHTNVSCFGGYSGTATITASGGTSPYIGEGTFSGLPAGTYTYIVTDALGCTDDVTVTITEPTLLVALESHTNVSCFGLSHGTATITGSGGTAPYLGEGTFSGLAAGTYTYIVTDALNCTDDVTVTITEPTVLVASESHTNVSCFGGNNGTATITASGGTAPYSGEGTFGGLAAGTYTYTVSDANGCTDDVTVTITEPTVLVASESHTNVSCFGGNNGTATITASGGTAPYSGEGTFTGLAAGTYTYWVTDALGCSDDVSVTITEPTQLVASESHVNVSCFGGSNGEATITASGGTSPYIGEGTFGGLIAGTYTYTVTDALGCSDDVTVIITEPTVLVASETHTDVTCFGFSDGTATITGSGGTAPYLGEGTFTGLAAGTYSYIVTDALGCTDDVSVTIGEPTRLYANETHTNVSCFGGSDGTATITASGGTGPYLGVGTFGGLIAGTYSYTVTDSKGCTADVYVTITEPTVLVAAETHTNINCFGDTDGTATITASGGTGPYVGEGTFTGLAAGTYTYWVTDALGCSDDVSVTITEPTELIASESHTNVSCFGLSDGTATITASGGTSPYTGEGTFIGLPAGTYNYVVTDFNYCTASVSVTITEPADFSVTCHGDFTICNLGTPIDLYGLGGFGTVPAGKLGSYEFYEGAVLIPGGMFDPAAAGIGPHTITFVFTDLDGCERHCDFVITVDGQGLASLEGQVKYWNATETYMQTPFPTDIYGTRPPDYYYVALYESTVTVDPNDPLVNATDWEKVDIVQTEVWDPLANGGLGAWVIDKDFMSYFKFETLLDPAKTYYMTVWDGSNLYQEWQNIGSTTGNYYNPELGSSYTWNNWGGVSGIDALGIQYMINGATNMHTFGWNWIGNQNYSGPVDYHYGFYSHSIGNVNSSANGITALDALTTQYRIAGLQPTFPNMTPNFRVSGRFVDELPKITWNTPFTNHNYPIDLEFYKSSANYTYFTPAINNYYQSQYFTTAPFYTVLPPSLGECPDFGYINLYYTSVGDVNASYVPPTHGFKAAEPTMTLQYENEIAVQKGEIINIPVSVDRSANLGSIALGLTFRNDLIKILEVPGYEVVNINNEKGFVRVVWADVNGRTVNSNEAIVTIQALVLADITADTRLFELEAMTELGNVNAQAIDDINLKTIAIATKPAINSDIFVANYPNPFNSKTTISYNLPEAGNVKLVVFNKLGAEITTLVNQFEAEGSYTIELNRGDLAAGVYYYRLVLQGKDTHTATKSMVITE